MKASVMKKRARELAVLDCYHAYLLQLSLLNTDTKLLIDVPPSSSLPKKKQIAKKATFIFEALQAISPETLMKHIKAYIAQEEFVFMVAYVKH